ncbi:MAG: DNA-binding protein [Aigarchaeota archaeon]|nr:DNA-binding protein [Candidatus Pelearchaeum maunauluense]
MSEDEELARIRQQKMAELQARIAEEQARRQREIERAAAMRIILTPEARQRLNNLKLVKPEIAERIEEYLIQAAQAGQLRTPIDDNTLKTLLDRVLPRRKDIRIVRR